MDIRKFFGGSPKGKSALSEIRAAKGSPLRTSPRKKRPDSLSKRKNLVVNLSDTDSDEENPIPSAVRKEMKKAKKPRRKALSSSDDELPPSASQPRPRKRGAKISSGSDKSVEVIDVRRVNKTQTVQNVEEESESEGEGDFVPAPRAKKSKRSTTPPGQSKLSFTRTSKVTTHQAKVVEKTSKARSMKKIDAADFFNNFGKTNEELNNEKKGNERATEKDATREVEKSGNLERNREKTSPSAGSNKGIRVMEESIRRSSKSPKKADTEKKHSEGRSHRTLKKKDSDIEILDEEVSQTRRDSDVSTPEKRSKKRPAKNSPVKEDTSKSAENGQHHAVKHGKSSKELHEEKGKEHENKKEKHDRKEVVHEERKQKSTTDGSERVKAKCGIAEKKKSPKERNERHHRHHEDEKDHHGKHDSSARRGSHSKEKSNSPPKASRATSELVKVTGKEVQKLRLEASSKAAPPSISVTSALPWVDKYKPMSVKQLVGQNGEKSPMNKLMGWLRDWPKYHLGEGAKQKKARPPPWLAQSDGTSFKAILLSGPPGIGKTTCAVLACKEYGLQHIEMNASDARNKKLLESKVAQLVGCHQIDEYFYGKSHKVAKSDELGHVLIMDEVDGMSGNEDRAGLAELIQMIKDSRIPIICICNDRQSQKMRSLVNYCFDVRFQRPRVEQIRSRMQTIAFQEKLKLTKEQIDEVIETSNHDVRQTIYNLQLLSLGGNSNEIQHKDCAVNTFEAARRILSADTKMMDKQEMFFVDYSIMPLFVQENYPNIQSNKLSGVEKLSALRKAADIISQGDIIDRTIRSTGAWALLNEQAMFSSILPSMHMNGYLKSMITFPSWLGKNSTAMKRQRLMRQLSSHTHLKISADCHSLVTDYVPILRDRLCRPLVEKESNGVSEVIETFEEYDLTRDDAEAVAELAVWPGMNDPGTKIQSKVKAALTRALNKEHRLLPYAIDDVAKGRKKNNDAAVEMEIDEEGNLVEVGGGDGLNEGSDDDTAPSSKPKAASKPSGSSSRGGRGGSRGAAGRGASRGRGKGRAKQ